ncbi:MAG: DUF4332 domain-containing protein [Anaerolineae bacterium]|nr:DUF4332 domain-containing protein [Anaerolineae bacterium]
MSTFTAIVIGILIGWIVEWIIDWLYWRRKNSALKAEVVALTQQKNEAEGRLAGMAKDLEALKATAVKVMPDDLKVIKGIGPEIERLLHAAGIKSFAQLSELSVDRLQELLGERVKRLSNEQSLIDQAAELARQQS